MNDRERRDKHHAHDGAAADAVSRSMFPILARGLIDFGAVAPVLARIVQLGRNCQHAIGRLFGPFPPTIKGVFFHHRMILKTSVRFWRGAVAGRSAMVQRLHHGDPHHHRVSPSITDHQQKLGGRLRMRQALLLFRQRGNEIAGIAQRLKRLAVRRDYRVVEPLVPSHLR
jgi:hypothetical protein